MKARIILLACLILLSACTEQTQTNQPPECTTNQDCTTASKDCCGCNAGGTQQAMPISQVKDYIQMMSNKCGDIMCIQVISEDPSCTKQAICKNGSCVLE